MDLLSRRADYDNGENDNEDVVFIKEDWLVQGVVETGWDRVEEVVRKAQSEISEGEIPVVKGLKEVAGVWKMGKHLFVPEGVRPDVMKEFHDSPLARYLGSTKMVELVQRRFWWPNIYKDV